MTLNEYHITSNIAVIDVTTFFIPTCKDSKFLQKSIIVNAGHKNRMIRNLCAAIFAVPPQKPDFAAESPDFGNSVNETSRFYG